MWSCKIDKSPPDISSQAVPKRFCCDLSSCFLFISSTLFCSHYFCIWLMVAEPLPCKEKASHLAFRAFL